MSWEKYEKAYEKGPGALFWKVFWPILGLVILFGGVGFVFGLFGSAAEVVEKTFDSDNIIYNYEWFHDKAGDLTAAENAIQITQESIDQFKEDVGPRENWTFQDREQYNQLTTDLRGQKVHFEQLKADFRAASEKVNREIFKGDSDIIHWADDLTGVQE